MDSTRIQQWMVLSGGGGSEPFQTINSLTSLSGGVGNASRVTACSADGTLFVGSAVDALGRNFGVIWSDGVPTQLAVYQIGTNEVALACSADASVIVGQNGDTTSGIVWLTGPAFDNITDVSSVGFSGPTDGGSPLTTIMGASFTASVLPTVISLLVAKSAATSGSTAIYLCPDDGSGGAPGISGLPSITDSEGNFTSLAGCQLIATIPDSALADTATPFAIEVTPTITTANQEYWVIAIASSSSSFQWFYPADGSGVGTTGQAWINNFDGSNLLPSADDDGGFQLIVQQPGVALVDQAESLNCCSADGTVWGGNCTTGSGAGFWVDGVLTMLPGVADATLTQVNGISADGTILVGQSDAPGVQNAVWWTRDGTLTTLPSLEGGTNTLAVACSHDGSIIVGTGTDSSANNLALLWIGGVLTQLPNLGGSTQSALFAISSDGSTAVGQTFDTSQPIVWTDLSTTPAVALLTVPGAADATAACVSSDGSVIGGNLASPSTPVTWTSGSYAAMAFLVAGTDAYAAACSSDGSFIVGISLNQNGEVAAYWDGGAALALDSGTNPQFSQAAGVSDDGSVMVGWIADDENAPLPASWVDGVLTPLALLPSGVGGGQALGCSANGNIIVGQAADADSVDWAVKWTSGTIATLPMLHSGGYASAAACSQNGSVIVGEAENGNDSLGHAVSWSGGVVTDLGLLPGSGFYSQATACSNDASVIVGGAQDASNVTQPVVWTSGVLSLLPTLGGHTGIANGVSGDGTIITGTSVDSGGTQRGVVWIGGSLTLLPGLADAVVLGSSLNAGVWVSRDGSTICGTASDANGYIDTVFWSN